MKSMGVGREKDCFGGIWIWMRAHQQWRRRRRERRGRDERKETREERWRQAVLPNGASYRAAQVHCHCIALHWQHCSKKDAGERYHLWFCAGAVTRCKSPKSPGHCHAPAQKIDHG
ncbi:uncharacterized protein SEPMUDRAFT_84826 [Sphaerulina musiva SO2202]|uniref:Uncharacterized protein n=1 Tax=Sphaerulina musiva (strain SO2202) TaxID=692275 RepID=M3B1N2_SPHMS|nr:uncharacterized protein SEPMUDRAFT_84826 [Sphaerulina musiva SO2202]EMF13712.1 hypothetical protein SEPMUDRAFT_84826 [Sphaerulina musiva SO2202]